MLKHQNVIIDDTNLNRKTFEGWRSLAKACGVLSEVVDMTDVPLQTCVMRDAARQKRVGFPVIVNMALKYGLHKCEPKSVVLCDLDGTLCQIDHRLHFVKRPVGEKDWKSFFEALEQDAVRSEVYGMLWDHAKAGRTIVFLSGRPDTYRDRTLAWFFKNTTGWVGPELGVRPFTLLMRRAGDHRPDDEVKKELLLQHFPLDAIYEVIDDRPSVLRMWASLGMNVVDVGQGVEF